MRISARPADARYTYGYGKIENLSALVETLLLLTCVWIIYEAIMRLFFKTVEVEASIWAFLIMGISISVDFRRSRALSRVAKKYDSQALEADALHFRTDIWSLAVIVLGLAGVWVASRLPGLSFLVKADSIAALFVAMLVIYVSFELGKRSIQGLLDTAPPDLAPHAEPDLRPPPEPVLHPDRPSIPSSSRN